MNSLWAFVLIAAAAAIFVFLIAPALLIFYSVFHRKKAIPFEKYNQKMEIKTIKRKNINYSILIKKK